MRTAYRWTGPALVAILIAACRASSTPVPVTPRPELHATAQRVVMISLDGYQAVHHRRLLAQGAYREQEGLTAFESQGYVVEHAVPVDPTLTAASHASIATGAPPAITGIVSNSFHIPGTPISQTVSGFSAEWSAEPLWVAFHRQGKRVGVLAFPGCDNTSAMRRADFGLAYSDGFARPQIVTMTATDFAPTSTTATGPVPSFAPERRATLTVKFAPPSGLADVQFSLTALDSKDDGVTAYDTLVIDDDGENGNGVLATVHVGDWFPLRFTTAHPDGGRRTVGAWCLLKALAPDLATVKIYRGEFNANEAYPREFRERLDREASFWPGPGDDRALESGIAGGDGLELADYLAQMRRFSAYFSTCARAAVAGEKFDLLLAYQPIVDEIQHALTISDPRQPLYSAGMAATAARAVEETYLTADAAVADLARTLDFSRDAFVVVSDHGIAPIWETVQVNEVLRRAGLAQQGERRGRPVVADSSQMVAVTSGGCAHLYVNLAGREPGGVVPPERLDDVVRKAAQALAQVEVAGEPVVEQAYTRAQLGAIGLDSRNAGDLVVFMKPGYAASSAIGGETHAPAGYTGQHGFRNTHEEMHGIWVARGAAVARGHRASASLTGVAAYVSHLAGVERPLQARPWQR